MSKRGEQFDAVSQPEPSSESRGQHAGRRRHLGILFACCSVYARVYVNRAGTAYVGHCPKCGRRVELKIGPNGTDARFFTAY